MQKALDPQHIFTVVEKDTYKVGEEIAVANYMVNDSRESHRRVDVFAEVFNAQGMRTPHAAFAAGLEADSAAKLVQSVKFRFHSPGERRLILTLGYGEKTFENECRLLIEG